MISSLTKADNLDLLNTEHYSSTCREFLEYYSLKPAVADLNFLQQLMQAFSSIPYENISKIIRLHQTHHLTPAVFRLPPEIWADFRNYALGGTCFSLTFFLQALLEYCGYNCYRVSADMRSGKNIHCALVVLLNEKSWLLDPGYLIAQPLALPAKSVNKKGDESRRLFLQYQPPAYHLYTQHNAQIKWRYSFRNLVCSEDDFVEFWLKSFQMSSMHSLCLTKQQKKEMVYVHNNYFRITRSSLVKKKKLQHGWLQEINSIFGIPLPLLQNALTITNNFKDNK